MTQLSIFRNQVSYSFTPDSNNFVKLVFFVTVNSEIKNVDKSQLYEERGSVDVRRVWIHLQQ